MTDTNPKETERPVELNAILENFYKGLLNSYPLSSKTKYDTAVLKEEDVRGAINPDVSKRIRIGEKAKSIGKDWFKFIFSPTFWPAVMAFLLCGAGLMGMVSLLIFAPMVPPAIPIIGMIATAFTALTVLSRTFIKFKSKSYANRFEKAIEQARLQYNKNQFAEASNTLNQELSRNIIVRAMRYRFLNAEHYAVAHLLNGSCLKKSRNFERAFSEYYKAFSSFHSSDASHPDDRSPIALEALLQCRHLLPKATIENKKKWRMKIKTALKNELAEFKTAVTHKTFMKQFNLFQRLWNGDKSAKSAAIDAAVKELRLNPDNFLRKSKYEPLLHGLITFFLYEKNHIFLPRIPQEDHQSICLFLTLQNFYHYLKTHKATDHPAQKDIIQTISNFLSAKNNLHTDDEMQAAFKESFRILQAFINKTKKAADVDSQLLTLLNAQNASGRQLAHLIKHYNLPFLGAKAALINDVPTVSALEKIIREIKPSPDIDKNCLLLVGPSGSGKTHTLTCLKEKGYSVFSWDNTGSDDHYVGKKAHRITEFFQQAKALSAQNPKPTIVFIDDMDVACTSKNGHSLVKAYQSECIAAFNKGIEQLQNENVLIVGAARNPERIDSKLRFPQRIDFSLPNAEARHIFLKNELSQCNIEQNKMTKLVELTHQWSFGQLGALTQLYIKSRAQQTLSEVFDKFCKTLERDFAQEMKGAEVMLPRYQDNTPCIDDLAKDLLNSNNDLIQKFNTIANWIKNPSFFKERPDLLMSGPPGGGKTTAVRKFIRYCNCPLFLIMDTMDEASFSKVIEKAKTFNSPVLLFIDEIDRMTRSGDPRTDGVRRRLQQLMDGFDKNHQILIIGATNYLKNIEEAIISRFTTQEVQGIGPEQLCQVLGMLINNELKADPSLSQHFDDDFNKMLETNSYADEFLDVFTRFPKTSIRDISRQLSAFFGNARSQLSNTGSAELKLQSLKSRIESIGQSTSIPQSNVSASGLFRRPTPHHPIPHNVIPLINGLTALR